MPDISIGAGRSELDDGPRLDKSGVVIDEHAGDLEVFQRPRGLHPVVRVRGNVLFAACVARASSSVNGAPVTVERATPKLLSWFTAD